MIDAQHAGELQVVAEVGADVTVAVLPGPFRVERRESPVLPTGEKGIGRCTDSNLRSEQAALTPNIVAVRVDAQRQVEIEARSGSPCLVRDRLQLLLGQPLHVEMILLHRLVKIAFLHDAVAQRCGPSRPGRPAAFAYGPETGIVLGVRVRRQEATKRLGAL